MTDSEERAAIALRLRKLIADKRMDVTECAKRSGVTTNALSRILNEPRTPNSITLKKLAVGLNVSADVILGIERPIDERTIDKARRLVNKLDDLLWGNQL